MRTTKIRVISFDVYGTILCADDYDNCMPARRGFIEFVNFCKQLGIFIVTSSDNPILMTKIDLSQCGVPLELFHNHYQMRKEEPKNFLPIIKFFNIKPENLLVFGDRFDFDIEPALAQGCLAILVPVYLSNDNFNWMSMVDEI